MSKRSHEYIKRQKEQGIVLVKVMIPIEKKSELRNIAEKWRDEARTEGSK